MSHPHIKFRKVRYWAGDVFDSLIEPVMFVIVVVGVVAALLFGLRALEVSQTKETCRSLNRQSGYEVKYIETSFFDYGCYAHLKDGTWLPYDQIREVNP